MNLASKNGATPLFLAAAWQRDECLCCILQARGEAGCVNSEGSWDDFQYVGICQFHIMVSGYQNGREY